MPKFNELRVNEIIDYCRNNKISVIIPTRDDELLYFAKNKQTFLENNIHVMISDYERIRNVLDKLLFFKECNQKEISTIKTVEDIEKIRLCFICCKRTLWCWFSKIKNWPLKSRCI